MNKTITMNRMLKYSLFYISNSFKIELIWHNMKIRTRVLRLILVIHYLSKNISCHLVLNVYRYICMWVIFQALFGIVCPIVVGTGATSMIIGSRGRVTRLAIRWAEARIRHGCRVRRKRCKRDVSVYVLEYKIQCSIHRLYSNKYHNQIKGKRLCRTLVNNTLI